MRFASSSYGTVRKVHPPQRPNAGQGVSVSTGEGSSTERIFPIFLPPFFFRRTRTVCPSLPPFMRTRSPSISP